MSRKRVAIAASSSLLLIAGWMPLGVATTLTVGGVMIMGCASEKSDIRQDERTEQRTEERMEERRD